MDYKGYTIKVREVLSKGTKKEAYQLIHPQTAHVLGTYKSISNAKKAINLHGERWLKLT